MSAWTPPPPMLASDDLDQLLALAPEIGFLPHPGPGSALDPTLLVSNKHNGWRCRASVHGHGEVRLWTKGDLPVTDQRTGFNDILRALPFPIPSGFKASPGVLVLDGELVAGTGTGHGPDGGPEAVRRALRDGQGLGLTFRIFDIVSPSHSLGQRSGVLAKAFQALGLAPDRPAEEGGVALVAHRPVPFTDIEDTRARLLALRDQALAEGWEGIVVKAAASPYVGGKSPFWVRLKGRE